MAEERDKLIRRYGGVPISEECLSDAELIRLYMDSYADERRLPPEIEAVRQKKWPLWPRSWAMTRANGHESREKRDFEGGFRPSKLSGGA